MHDSRKGGHQVISLLFHIALIVVAVGIVGIVCWGIKLLIDLPDDNAGHAGGGHTWPGPRFLWRTFRPAPKLPLRVRAAAAVRRVRYWADCAAELVRQRLTPLNLPGRAIPATAALSETPAGEPARKLIATSHPSGHLAWTATTDDLPHLRRQWADDTGTFTALAGVN